jgi:hypothetical protein
MQQSTDRIVEEKVRPDNGNHNNNDENNNDDEEDNNNNYNSRWSVVVVVVVVAGATAPRENNSFYPIQTFDEVNGNLGHSGRLHQHTYFTNVAVGSFPEQHLRHITDRGRRSIIVNTIIGGRGSRLLTIQQYCWERNMSHNKQTTTTATTTETTTTASTTTTTIYPIQSSLVGLLSLTPRKLCNPQ